MAPMVWEKSHSTPLCNHVIDQTLWKKNGPHGRRMLGTMAIAVNFQDTKAENGHFWTQNRP